MSIAVELIREAETYGTTVTIDGEQLKLLKGKLLPPSFLDKLKANKDEIQEVMRLDLKARQEGFMSLWIGGVYERQITHNSHVFIIQNDSGTWDAWRETWSQKGMRSTSCKVIESECVSFEYALVKAKQYLQYLNKQGS